MKILLLSDDFPPESFGGAGIVAFSNAKKLVSLGHDVFVITTIRDKKKEGALDYEGIKVFRLYSDYHERWRAYLSLYNPQVVKKLKTILANEKPDVVHAHNIHKYISYYSLWVSRRYSRAVFLTAHDAMSFAYGKVLSESKISYWELLKSAKFRFNPFRNIVIRIFFNKYVDKIFSVSESLARALRSNKIVNVEVVHNGIEPSDWISNQKEVGIFREKLAIPADKKIILFGGRLSGMKGGKVIIDVLKIVVNKIPEIILLVVGTKNEYAEKMLAYAKGIGLDKNIIFTGWLSRDTMRLVYGISDVVAVASLYMDALVMVNLEAHSSARPILGTIFGGTKEIVQDGKTGYLVDPKDKYLFASKLTELLLNKDKSIKFGLAGRERVNKFFTEDVQIKKILFWYNEFLKK